MELGDYNNSRDDTTWGGKQPELGPYGDDGFKILRCRTGKEAFVDGLESDRKDV